MSATNLPFGLRAAFHPSGQMRPLVIPLGIASGYATAIGQGSPVKYATDGTLQRAAAGDSFVGAFVGVQYTPSAGARPVFSNQWVASATYITTEPMFAIAYVDPLIEYEIQANGSLAQTSVGDMADFAVVTNNTTTGYSDGTISTTLVGAGASAQLQILGLYPGVDNAWGDAFTVVRVRINEHQFQAGVNAI